MGSTWVKYSAAVTSVRKLEHHALLLFDSNAAIPSQRFPKQQIHMDV